jgi:hypothetical protein
VTTDDVEKVMFLVAAYWPHWPVPETEKVRNALIGAWHRQLGDLDASVVTAAVDALSARGDKFAPGPGEVRKLAMELSQPKPLLDVDEAWAEVLERIGSVGRYLTPEWSHPAIAGAVLAMGWVRLCESEDHMADRAHFLRLYGKVHDRTMFTMTMPPSVLDVVTQARGLGVGHAGELER